jgi:hypothetical protein
LCGSFLLCFLVSSGQQSTDSPAVFVKTGFIDSTDVQIPTAHGDDIAKAIARCVTDYASV